jgi:hypothetical protein
MYRDAIAAAQRFIRVNAAQENQSPRVGRAPSQSYLETNPHSDEESSSDSSVPETPKKNKKRSGGKSQWPLVINVAAIVFSILLLILVFALGGCFDCTKKQQFQPTIATTPRGEVQNGQSSGSASNDRPGTTVRFQPGQSVGGGDAKTQKPEHPSSTEEAPKSALKIDPVVPEAEPEDELAKLKKRMPAMVEFQIEKIGKDLEKCNEELRQLMEGGEVAPECKMTENGPKCEFLSRNQLLAEKAKKCTALENDIKQWKMWSRMDANRQMFEDATKAGQTFRVPGGDDISFGKEDSKFQQLAKIQNIIAGNLEEIVDEDEPSSNECDSLEGTDGAKCAVTEEEKDIPLFDEQTEEQGSSVRGLRS